MLGKARWASLLANTPVFFLDARGLQGLTPYQDVDTAAAVDPWDVTDSRSAESAAAGGRGPDLRPGGAFRKTQVKVGGGAKGLRVMARRGYFATPSAGH